MCWHHVSESILRGMVKEWTHDRIMFNKSYELFHYLIFLLRTQSSMELEHIKLGTDRNELWLQMKSKRVVYYELKKTYSGGGGRGSFD